MTKESESDEWWITKELYHELEKKYNLRMELDVACTLDNCINGWGFYHDLGEDALKKEWILTYSDGRSRTTDVWCNPPLNKLQCKKFVLKAEEQWRKHNINILMPLPIGVCSRKYFRHLWNEFKSSFGKTIDIDPIDRPKFSNKGKEARSARNDYMVLLFRKR